MKFSRILFMLFLFVRLNLGDYTACDFLTETGDYYDLRMMSTNTTQGDNDFRYVDMDKNKLYFNLCADSSYPCDPYSPVCQLASPVGTYFSFGILSTQTVAVYNNTDGHGPNVRIAYSQGQKCLGGEDSSTTILITCNATLPSRGSVQKVVYSASSCHYDIYMTSRYACPGSVPVPVPVPSSSGASSVGSPHGPSFKLLLIMGGTGLGVLVAVVVGVAIYIARRKESRRFGNRYSSVKNTAK
eukprot:TRINITY_DN9108_c0_g1_i2.p1 TRINITY_DN9108_c0_g1~~TRINITY_DN9108_c0_g1_i2.p1  ORF type:complete len:267 (-),score=49.53 TRINITY_DN9108_c0_g1_i2:17-742(-)